MNDIIYPVFAFQFSENFSEIMPTQQDIIAIFINKEDMIEFCFSQKAKYFLIFGGAQKAKNGFNSPPGTLFFGIRESVNCKTVWNGLNKFYESEEVEQAMEKINEKD